MNAKMQIILHIIQDRKGPENAVTVRELGYATGLNDERTIRRYVRRLKLLGHLIASGATGYCTPIEADDAAHSIAILRNEEKQIRVVRRAQERSARQVFPRYAEQLSFLEEAA